MISMEIKNLNDECTIIEMVTATWKTRSSHMIQCIEYDPGMT